VQQWDELLPKGYKTSGVNRPSSRQRLVWDGSFTTQRHSVASQLEAGAVGYGADGQLPW